jgi:Protein of unknown function (DUF1461)
LEDLALGIVSNDKEAVTAFYVSMFIIPAIYSLVYILVNAMWSKRNGRRDVGLGAAWGGGLTIGVIAFLGIFVVTSFNSFFFTFHEIFFPEGNWQFPPGDHNVSKRYNVTLEQSAEASPLLLLIFHSSLQTCDVVIKILCAQYVWNVRSRILMSPVISKLPVAA